MTDPESVSERVARVALAHPSVRVLYSAQPVALDVARSALAGVLPVPAMDRVVVSQADGGTAARVCVGVRGDAPTAETSRELYALIAAELAATGAPQPFAISIRVASIG